MSQLGQGSRWDGTYLTGSKVQAVVFADDLSRCFIGGNGVVYVIDMLSFKLVETIRTGGGSISSLAAVGRYLYIGQGNNYPSGTVKVPLLVADITPRSTGATPVIAVPVSKLGGQPLGISGMTLGADKRTLVVATPLNPNSVMLGNPDKRGNLWLLDTASLNSAKRR